MSTSTQPQPQQKDDAAIHKQLTDFIIDHFTANTDIIQKIIIKKINKSIENFFEKILISTDFNWKLYSNLFKKHENLIQTFINNGVYSEKSFSNFKTFLESIINEENVLDIDILQYKFKPPERTQNSIGNTNDFIDKVLDKKETNLIYETLNIINKSLKKYLETNNELDTEISNKTFQEIEKIFKLEDTIKNIDNYSSVILFYSTLKILEEQGNNERNIENKFLQDISDLKTKNINENTVAAPPAAPSTTSPAAPPAAAVSPATPTATISIDTTKPQPTVISVGKTTDKPEETTDNSENSTTDKPEETTDNSEDPKTDNSEETANNSENSTTNNPKETTDNSEKLSAQNFSVIDNAKNEIINEGTNLLKKTPAGYFADQIIKNVSPLLGQNPDDEKNGKGIQVDADTENADADTGGGGIFGSGFFGGKSSSSTSEQKNKNIFGNRFKSNIRYYG